MRLNRNTLLLLGGLIAFIVGAVVVLNQTAATPADPAAAPTLTASEALVLGDVGFEAVRRLTIADAAGASVSVVQNADLSWSIEGRAEPALQGEIDRAVSNLVNIQAFERFPADDLAPFGLAQPVHTITIHDGTRDVVLRVGHRNPGGTRQYAMRDDQPNTVLLLSNPAFIFAVTGFLVRPPVVQVTPTLPPALDRPGFLFPEFTGQRIVRVSLRSNIGTDNLTLIRDEAGTWSLDPFSTGYRAQPIDQMVASTLAEVFGSLQALDVLTNVDEAGAAALGLAPPRYTLQAVRDDGYEYTIVIGGNDPSGTRTYARIFELPNVAVMDRAEVDGLLQFIGAPPFEATAETTPEATAEATPETTAEATP